MFSWLRIAYFPTSVFLIIDVFPPLLEKESSVLSPHSLEPTLSVSTHPSPWLVRKVQIFGHSISQQPRNIRFCCYLATSRFRLLSYVVVVGWCVIIGWTLNCTTKPGNHQVMQSLHKVIRFEFPERSQRACLTNQPVAAKIRAYLITCSVVSAFSIPPRTHLCSSRWGAEYWKGRFGLWGESVARFAYLEMTGGAVLIRKTEIEETQFQYIFQSRIPQTLRWSQLFTAKILSEKS